MLSIQGPEGAHRRPCFGGADHLLQQIAHGVDAAVPDLVVGDLRRVDVEARTWEEAARTSYTIEDGAWAVAEKLDEIRHYRLITRAQERLLKRRDPFERDVALLTQYRRPQPARRAAMHKGAR